MPQQEETLVLSLGLTDFQVVVGVVAAVVVVAFPVVDEFLGRVPVALGVYQIQTQVVVQAYFDQLR